MHWKSENFGKGVWHVLALGFNLFNDVPWGGNVEIRVAVKARKVRIRLLTHVSL